MLQSTEREFYLYCLELEQELEQQTGKDILVCPYQPKLFRQSNYISHHSWEFAQIMLTDYGQAAVYMRNPVKLWGSPLALLVALVAAITTVVFLCSGDSSAITSGSLGIVAVLIAIVLSKYSSHL